ncbi:MAG: SIR2 family protein [Planctomycetota bacterium]
MTWPHYLVEELADRRCVIVVGSGISSSCETSDGERPPGWSALLDELAALISDVDARNEAKRLITEKQLLRAAQVVADKTLAEDRERIIKRRLERQYQPSKWIELIRDFDQNVMVTTNYDCLLEDACPREGFRTHIHKDQEAVKVLRAPERLILKLHGCIRRDPGSLVLSMSDYHAIRADYPHCLKLLESVFVTHTALFLGYSIQDPDMQLVMQNISIAFPHAQPHIILTSDPMHASVRSAMERSLNLKFVCYDKGRHKVGLEMLESLFEDVQSMRASR